MPEIVSSTMKNTYERTPEGNIKCPYCDYNKPPKNMSSVCMHIKHKHSGAFKYKCNHCNFETAAKQNLDNHILARHPDITRITVKEFECPHESCTYAANQKGQLRSHYILKHLTKELHTIMGKTEDNQLQCTHCSSIFPSKPAFIYHSVNCFQAEVLAVPEVRLGLGLS
jgi:DNA-directed RNA polymerase subunit RPC12/RpoP